MSEDGAPFSGAIYPAGESWWEAYTFAAWVGARLPTEEEWEYAARAGTLTPYWSGDAEEDLARVGWYSENAQGTAHPVGEKAANEWGLHDMHGNVWEWTSSMWREGYSEPEPAEDAHGDRVIRGGSFFNDARNARSALRNRGAPGTRGLDLGFRVLRLAPPSPCS